MPIVSARDVRVNTYATGLQSDATTTALVDGGWIATWLSLGQDGSGTGIYQQVFNANGSRRGGETRINSTTAGNQLDQQVTLLKNGGWVVTWLSESSSDVYQRVYNANGTARTQEAIVYKGYEGSGDQAHPRITALADGGWVVALQQHTTFRDVWWNTIGSWWEPLQVIYNADGTYRSTFNHTGEAIVGNFHRGDRYDPEVTSLKNGGWVVAWVSRGQGFPDNEYHVPSYAADIFLEVYDASGKAVPGLGNQQQSVSVVNSYTAGNQYAPEIKSLPSGGWIVTWISDGQDGSGQGIYQQAYNSARALVGAETRVNSFTTGNQYDQQTAVLANGGWVVTWTSYGQDGSGAGVYQRAFNANGTARSGEMRVNSFTTGDQGKQQVTALADGGWVVTWESLSKDGYSTDIYQRVYKPNGAAFGNELVIATTQSVYDQRPQITALKNGGWVITWEGLATDITGGLEQSIYQKQFSNSSAPVITSNGGGYSATIKIVENKTAVTTAKATDYERKAVTWSIDGGDDKAWFTIDPKTGVLKFKGAPNYEAPVDKNKDNTYLVTIKVTDSETFIDTQSINVVVADVKGRTLTGNAQGNYLVGTSENDVLNGGAGNDRLVGGNDPDRLYGSSGNDSLYGGSGNDILSGGSEDDILSGDAGNDVLFGDWGNDKLYGKSGNDKLYGSEGDDRLFGEDGNDLIHGQDGKDTLLGQDGNDMIDGGKGNDIIDGGADDDKIWGQAGIDVLWGGIGNDTIYGGSGNDFLSGEWGRDALYGGSGSDIFYLDIPQTKRGQEGEIDTIYDFQRGSDHIDLSGLSWISDIDGLSYRGISIYMRNDSGGVVITHGVRVLYDGVALVDVVADSLSAGDFILY